MKTSDELAVLALVISSGALFLEVRRWFESRPRLHLSVMADAVEFPHDDGKPKLALSVINRGNMPTTITHMVAFIYPSRWYRIRRKPEYAGFVSSDRIPAEFGVNKTWLGMMQYDDKLAAARTKGSLYVGVIASHAKGEFLTRVPSKRRFPTEGASDPGSES